MVNSVLAADLASGRLHSVRMKCWTPAQWEAKAARTFNPGEPCPLASPILQLPMPGPLQSIDPMLVLPSSCTQVEQAPRELCECGGRAV